MAAAIFAVVATWSYTRLKRLYVPPSVQRSIVDRHETKQPLELRYLVHTIQDVV